MANKWCFKCNTKLNAHDQFCGECGSSSFVHQDPATMDLDASQGYGLVGRSEIYSPPLAPSNSSSRSNKSTAKETGDLNTQISKEDELNALIRENIRASNRTTHAVRAFVRFLFIQLSATTLAGFIFGIASSQDSPNSGLIFLAVVIWLVGVVWSSQAGWSELEKSNVPGA